MPVTHSPLRYPGGKTKLYCKVQPIIQQELPHNNQIYIEPYAGGAGLALKLLYMGDVSKLILNDVDEHIFSFWNICLKDADSLCSMIDNCVVDMVEWKKQKEIYKNSKSYSWLENAFATFFLNRCNVSGIIEGGPIGGMEQKGQYKLDARFNKKELIRKIKKIELYKNQIEFYNLDAIDFLNQIVVNVDIKYSFVNLDPPYVKKGPMLYNSSYTKEDHIKIAEAVTKLEQKWIVTYDECDFIRELYGGFLMEVVSLGYSAGRAKKGNELIIYSRKI